MKLNSLSQPLLVRLMDLDARADALAERAGAAEAAVDEARAIMNGRRPPPGANTLRDIQEGVAAVQAGFETQYRAAQQARRTADAAHTVLSNLKVWLERLPPDAKLEPVELEPEDLGLDELNLADVRDRRRQLAADIRALQLAPLPSPDLRERVATYVKRLAVAARPEVRGIAGGEQLVVYWPDSPGASRQNLNGFDTVVANPLLLAAFLFPDRLVDRIGDTIDAACREPCPPPQRAERLAALTAELDRLWQLETALVDQAVGAGDADATHDVTTPPAAVLGVRDCALVDPT